MSKLAPSILGANVLQLGEEARSTREAGCERLHLDIMDGVFVPNISFGPAVAKALRTETKQELDVHLMLLDPLPYIQPFAKAGADILTVHVEAEHFAESIAEIHRLSLKAGASLKPRTPVTELRELLPQLDMVLVMTVEPGFGGQKLMEDQLGKLRELRALGFTGELEVDGGITRQNAAHVAEMGADALVMGTAFFTAEDKKALTELVRALPSRE